MPMSLASILGGGIGELADKIGGVVDRFVHTGDEKAAVMIELEKLAQQSASELENTMRTELQTKEKIMVAELTSGDSYTKRARPTVVYAGLVIIFINYVLAPILARFAGIQDFPELTLPTEFWYGWSGIVATWSVGRSMERRGSKNNLLSVISGKTPSLID
jgi:hypothetical protein